MPREELVKARRTLKDLGASVVGFKALERLCVANTHVYLYEPRSWFTSINLHESRSVEYASIDGNSLQ